MGSAAGTAPDDDVAGIGFERVRAVADAILYEGYLLYPYRRSSAKNRVRWQFGIVAPRSWAERDGPVPPSVAGSVESWQQQTECLARVAGDAEAALVHVRVRFLQVQSKTVERAGPGGRYTPVDSLEIAGEPHLSFDEAVPRECDLVAPLPDLAGEGRTFTVGAPGGELSETLDGDVGRIVRRRRPLSASATLCTEPLSGEPRAYRLRLRIENTASEPGPGGSRTEALRHSLIATHAFLGGSGVRFCSLLDPPAWAEPHVADCHNLHTFPVLAGHGCLLSSPILLPDQPQVAPESPGDLHDAAEIDEILSLRTLTLTDEEKREARATDPRAAEILDRVDDMPPEVLARLHGTLRPPEPAQPDGDHGRRRRGWS